jgi:hypothetical protein
MGARPVQAIREPRVSGTGTVVAEVGGDESAAPEAMLDFH